jgi:drug/metabolite transporter (DMT)-like permease
MVGGMSTAAFDSAESATPGKAAGPGKVTEAGEVAGAGQVTEAGKGAPSRLRLPRVLVSWRLRFAALSLIWGFSFLFIKVATAAYAPLQLTFGRLVFGAAVLGVGLLVRGDRLPRVPRTWGHLTIAAFFLNALPWSLFAYAELTIPSWLAGVCNATTPLWGMALALVALSEDRPTRRRVAGLGIGFVGVLVVLGAWQGFTGVDPGGTLMALAASASYALGWVYLRRFLADAPDSNISMSAAQLVLGAVQVGVAAAALTSLPETFPVVPLLAVVVLGVFGSGIAFLLQFGLVVEAGPTIAQMVTYFIPVIATVAGVAVLGEALSWYTPVGALVILVGAALTQSKPRGGRRRAAGRRVPETSGGRVDLPVACAARH